MRGSVAKSSEKRYLFLLVDGDEVTKRLEEPQFHSLAGSLDRYSAHAEPISSPVTMNRNSN